MGIQIRTAGPDDAADACRVLCRSITECCVADHHDQPAVLQGWLGNKTPDNVASWIASPSNHTLVALRDLLPEAHGLGIGKAMLECAEAQARSWGVSVLRLHGTASARDFFARNGYVLAGKEKSCYGVECDFFWKKLNLAANDAATPAQRFCSCSAQ